MSLKKKLVATIGMFCLTCALLLVGVWAINNASVEISGTISFEAKNIFATVEGDIQGAGTNVVNPDTLTYTLTDEPTDEQLATWKQNLTFEDSGETITYTITITNDSENRDILVAVVDNSVVGANITQTISLTVNGKTVDYVSAQQYKVAPKQTAVVVATFAVDPDVTAEGEYGFEVKLDGLTEHTHNYDGEVYYVVEDGVAYSVQKCTCGEAENKTELIDAIVVTNNEEDANYYQTVLDGDVNGKTIVFAPGEYAYGIMIRPSAATVSKIYNDFEVELSENDTPVTVEVTGEEMQLDEFLAADDLTSTDDTYKKMAYERNISNLTLLGSKGAIFRNQFRFAGLEDTDDHKTFDAVRGEYLPRYDATRDYTYASILNIDGLTISNMDFKGKAGDICYYSYIVEGASNIGPGSIKNFTLQNCTFINDEDTDYKPYGALRFFSTTNNFENFVIKNNVVDGHYQGFLVQNVKNIRIENNQISNTTHNAIAVQSHNDDTYSSGEIVIANNTINTVLDKGTGKNDRAIRMGIVKDATITISGNTFANAAEVKGEFKEILKATSLSNVSYSFAGNTYDRVAVEDDEDTVATDANAEWVVKIPV